MHQHKEAKVREVDGGGTIPRTFQTRLEFILSPLLPLRLALYPFGHML